MKKKAKKRGIGRMKDLGYKPVTAFLRLGLHGAMDAYTSGKKISHSEYIAALVAEDLVKKGFLGKELAASLGRKKKVSAGKRR